MDAKCRWRSDQQDNAWSNKSDANPPGRDTKPPGHSSPDVGQNKIFENGLCGLNPLICI